MAANVKDINKVSEVKPINLNKIPKDVKDFAAAQSAVSEATGELGNLVKKLEKERGYNRAAFKLGVALSKKTVQKRQDFLMTLDAMRDKLGWDHEQPDMLDGSNVVRIGSPQRDEGDEEDDTAPPSPAEEINPNEGERALQS